MQNNFSGFPVEEIRRLAETTTGQQLIAALRQSNNSTFDQAASYMMAGQTEEAKQALLPLLQDPHIRKLLQQLGG